VETAKQGVSFKSRVAIATECGTGTLSTTASVFVLAQETIFAICESEYNT
jgi:hypothetical protein